jgi:hypothetical protein
MFRRSFVAAAILAVSATVLPGAAAPSAAGGALSSPNVEFQATIPDPAIVGARKVGNILYTTSASGLRTYDISAGIPKPVGALALPHYENENVDTNGKLLIIVADHFVAGESETPSCCTLRNPQTREPIARVPLPAGNGPTNIMYVIDVVDPAKPTLKSVTLTRSGHTATCIASCRYVWLSGSGRGVEIMDLADPMHPQTLGFFGPSAHNVNVDSAGIAWISAWDGLFAYTTTNPAKPVLIAKRTNPAPGKKDPKAFHNDFIIHNSLRPNAHRTTPTKLADNKIDIGEVVLVTEENWMAAGNDFCANDGQFQTGWFHTVNGKPVIEKIDTFKIGQGTLTDATAPAKPAGVVSCSSHWFDEFNGIVANAWYEQGVRFFDVRNPRDIRQIAYWMPAVSEVWQAMFHLVGTTMYVYAFDADRGVDVLTINLAPGNKNPTVVAPTLRASSAPLTPHPSWGLACRLKPSV